MNLQRILLLCSVLLVGYLGFTLQAYERIQVDYTHFEPLPEPEPEPVPIDDIQDFVDEYSAFFEHQFDSLKTVGGAMTIVYKGQVAFCKPYGVKKVRTTDSVDIHTRFRLASVSKGFAGVIATKMAERGVIDLDTPIISYLPSLHLSKAYNQEHLTMRHVLSHTSGLLGYSFDPYVESGLSYNAIYNKLHVAKIDGKPGEHYAYQNVIFSLLDTVLQEQTGMTYADLMTENLFKPLGMKDASVGFNGFWSSQNYANPHKMISAKTLTYKVRNFNTRYYCTAPAAGVNASIADMSLWLRALQGFSPNVVSPEVIEEVGTEFVRIPSRGQTRYWGSGLQRKAYGLGWRVFTHNGEKVLYHGGYVEGYRAEVVLIPSRQIAMAMMINSPNVLAQKAAPYFVNMYMDYVNSAIAGH